MKHFCLLVVLLLSRTILYAQDIPVKFNDAASAQRYYKLLEEVRCLVCQNQSLADSNAELAQDLRTEIYEKIIAGEDNHQIIRFLVERYGDFVLYRPPLQTNTWLLWFGPFTLLLIAIAITMIFIKRQSNEAGKEQK